MISPSLSRWRRALRATLWIVAVLTGFSLIAVLAGFFWFRGRMLASLPHLDGTMKLAGLSEAVVVQRDALGIPTVKATNRLDLARVTGFLHAQDRFFQMDLMRRQAAGELAELVGPAAVDLDRRVRVHRFRARARKTLTELEEPERRILESYAQGVNAGLAALDSKPPEYWALRTHPSRWRGEDTALVIFAMYLMLQGDRGSRESFVGLMHDLLPQELVEFLLPRGTEWDAPLVGEGYVDLPMPGPAIVDLRNAPSPQSSLDIRPSLGGEIRLTSLGASNNWAISAERTAAGSALLSNDLHLSLSLPNTWYRMSWIWSETDLPSEHHRIAGASLPGAPAIVIGSNGHIAWGFTNTEGDWIDLVVLEVDPRDETRYRTESGYIPIAHASEVIEVRGAEAETLEVLGTEWGPVIDHDYLGRPRALRWVAHERGAVNLDLLHLEKVRTVREALDIAPRVGIPTANFVVVDGEGHIGWTLMGRVPRRVGFSGRLPVSWAEGSRGWQGWIDAEDYPRVLDPEGGQVWTSNNRVLGRPGHVTGQRSQGSEVVEEGFFDLGARAKQIRDALQGMEGATPADMLALQLDDRALFLRRWRDLLLDTLTDETLEADSRRAEFRRLVREDWSGQASVESTGYRLVRAFRHFLARQVFESLTAPCREADADFDYLGIAQWEGPLWRLIQERPPHLLNARFATWTEQLLAAVDASLDYLLPEEKAVLSEQTWGRRNTVRIRHPLSGALPYLSRWLDVPPEALPGDAHMPRVQGVTFGASQRMVVSPGREEAGIFHMPGGQSGHPLSMYYRKGHEAWAKGEPTAFLPGPTVHTLTLLPDR